MNDSANIQLTTFSCPNPRSCRYDRKVYGCNIHPFENSKAGISYSQLKLLRDGFEDNISETDMIEVVDHDGKSIFWGSFDELIQKLKN